MKDYKNLPGVGIHVKDGQMMNSDDMTTNSMLIIGDVKPGNVVVDYDDAKLIRTEEELFVNYGQYFDAENGMNPIAAEWHIAKQAGVRNTYLLALEGDTKKEKFVNLQDKLFNLVADYQFSHIILASMYADETVEGLTLDDFKTVNPEITSLEQVIGLDNYFVHKSTAKTETLELTEAKTLEVSTSDNEPLFVVNIKADTYSPAQLVGELNLGFKKAVTQVGLKTKIRVDLDNGAATIKSTDKVSFTGTEVLAALNITLPEDEKVPYGNVTTLLAEFSERQIRESDSIIAYVGTAPAATTKKSDIRNKVNELAVNFNEASRHVQVVAGPEVGINIPGSLRTQWVSGVTQYAVLVNSLAVQNAPTNQPLPAANALRYDLSLKQLDDLVGNKYVTFRTKNNRIVVVDAITTAPDLFVGQDLVRSDFTRLSTLRSTSYMVSAIRAVTDPFIGRPNEFPTYNAMNTAIRGVINLAIERGVIQDASYSIELGENLDAASVKLTILPQFELRKINVEIGLTTPSGFSTI